MREAAIGAAHADADTRLVLRGLLSGLLGQGRDEEEAGRKGLSEFR
jgi:hypothetical protein